MDTVRELVPFPLYHGTSSHYLPVFQPGTTPKPWHYKDAALALLQATYSVLLTRKHELTDEVRKKLLEDWLWDVNHQDTSWYVEGVIHQKSEYTNWQHGELYVTPSKGKAVEYAYAGAKYGGELLTFCKRAIDILAVCDPKTVDDLTQQAGCLTPFFRGTDQPPIVVEFENVRIADLSPEREGDDVGAILSDLTDQTKLDQFGRQDRVLELFGQQPNLRLANACGVVGRVSEVFLENPDDPLTPFRLRDISRESPHPHG